jgi:hypothetical protein
MKQKLVLCGVLLLLFGFADIAVARNSTHNDGTISADLSRADKQVTRMSLQRLPYKNLLESSKWSRLSHGRVLAASLRKKNAHSLQDPDLCTDCDLLFPGDGEGEMIGPLYDMNDKSSYGGGCDWKCCFKTCVDSAMSGTGSLCITSCTACGTVGGAFACAVCASCGAVGFAAIEFCSLHCCVNPGCPAGP